MSIDIGAEVEINLTEETSKTSRGHSDRQQLAQEIYQFPFTPLSIPLASGSGTLDEPGQFAPPRGFMWCVRRLTLAGYSAGSVVPYIDDFEPILLPNAGAAQTVFIGKAEWLLDSGQRLKFVATGITGAVFIFGAVDVFPRDLLPIYLSIGQRDAK